MEQDRARVSRASKPVPFLKWLGGKRRLIPKVKHLFPKTFKTYIEPFVGAGSILFHLKPEKAVIADAHKDLINSYQWIKKDPEGLNEILGILKDHHTAERFYTCRMAFNANRDLDLLRAARFVYLNCKCYNGLCRYNQSGGFNAPLHKISHLTRKIPFPEEIVEVSRYLQGVEIFHCDFREIPTPFEPGDFVVIDPPYWPYWKQGFTNYTGTGFIEKDQMDLLTLIDALTDYGVLVMAWNSDVDAVHRLYHRYHREAVSVKSCVGQKSYEGKKKLRYELCITNYDPDTSTVIPNLGEL